MYDILAFSNLCDFKSLDMKNTLENYGNCWKCNQAVKKDDMV